MTTTRGSTALKEKHVVTRNFVRECLVAGWVLLLTLGALEVAVRAWGYSEPHIYDSIYISRPHR